jgi:hypothetical protein
MCIKNILTPTGVWSCFGFIFITALDDRIRMFSWVSQGLDCWFLDGFNADYNISRELPGFKLLINSYSDIIDNKYPYNSTLCKTKQVGKT